VIRTIAVAALGLAIAAPLPAFAAEPREVPGLVVYASEYGVDETAQRVQDALSAVGMVTATLDHQANAESVGEELRPTTLVIGGAPEAGTPLLLEAQEVGIDLPQKYLSWQDEAGAVWLAYNSAEYVATQAGIATDSDSLSGLMEGSAGLAAEASGTDEPASGGAAVSQYDGYRIEQVSDGSVDEAIARYEAAFTGAGLEPLATVDHQAGAASIGADLRPTQVTYVGNPELGSPLIAAEQTVGIDLPARYLAWEEENGEVTVAHVDIDVIAEQQRTSPLPQRAARPRSAPCRPGVSTPVGAAPPGWRTGVCCCSAR
jgi:uncharacterized protein (DUF302 family)